MPTLEITTNIGCLLQCSVCPQKTLINSYKSNIKKLSFDNFKIIIDKVPKYVRIDFSGMSEPWLNEECNKMLEYTLQSNFLVAIYTTFGWINRTICK